MDDRDAGMVTTTDTVVVTDAYGTARELLLRAEADAAQVRADADRYLRQREQEAELLVGRARRLLAMAEQRARALGPTVVDLEAPASADVDDEALSTPGSRRPRSQLDSILATAVSNAIHRALPAER